MTCIPLFQNRYIFLKSVGHIYVFQCCLDRSTGVFVMEISCFCKVEIEFLNIT
jgi:hypothetical protein